MKNQSKINRNSNIRGNYKFAIFPDTGAKNNLAIFYTQVQVS